MGVKGGSGLSVVDGEIVGTPPVRPVCAASTSTGMEYIDGPVALERGLFGRGFFLS